MTDQHKSDQAPHNLYEHLEAYDQVQGSFSQETKPVSLQTGLATRPALRWGLLAVLAGAGFALLTRRKKARWPAGWASQLIKLVQS